MDVRPAGPPRLLVTARAFALACPAAAKPLEQVGVQVRFAPRMGPLAEDLLVPLLAEADAVIASSDAYTARVLEAAPRLRGIVRWGVGYDSIDLAAATRHGVVVANVPGANTEAVADFVLALLLNLARPMEEGRAALRRGEWRQEPGVELPGKTLGIVGFGAIGRAVARRARGFDMRLLAHDPYASADSFAAHEAESVGLLDLLRRSDFVTLHATLTPDTLGMIGREALRAMKPTAFLINAGRGALVDEAALLEALEEGWIAGAAVDCYTAEPPPADHPLLHHPRCFATPHNAFNTAEVGERVSRVAAEQALAILQGRRPQHVVNPAVYERET